MRGGAFYDGDIGHESLRNEKGRFEWGRVGVFWGRDGSGVFCFSSSSSSSSERIIRFHVQNHIERESVCVFGLVCLWISVGYRKTEKRGQKAPLFSFLYHNAHSKFFSWKTKLFWNFILRFNLVFFKS